MILFQWCFVITAALEILSYVLKLLAAGTVKERALAFFSIVADAGFTWAFVSLYWKS